MSTAQRVIGQERTFALLGVTEVTSEQIRGACVTLAGLALKAADGDSAAARALLEQPLAAIGVTGHEAHRRYPDGRVVKAKERRQQEATS